MTSLLSRLRRSTPLVIVECRRCGTTLAENDGACDSCGVDDVARYVIRE